MVFQAVPTPKSLKMYLSSLVEHFELDIKRESAEMGRSALVWVISENDIGIGECYLQLTFIDTEDIAEAWALELLEEASHARQDLLEEVQRRTQH